MNSIQIMKYRFIFSIESPDEFRHIWTDNVSHPHPHPQEILVGFYDLNGYPYIGRWNLKNGTLLSSTPIYGQCYFIFVDINDDLYCSARDLHMVMRKSWRSQSNSFTIVAGTGSSRSSAAMLSSPRGIFVTSTLDLYVVDCCNSRVQLFRSGQINAITVAGYGSNSILTLDCPSGITLDADGYLFIVSYSQHRVVVVGGGKDRCIVGCNGTAGSAANLLYYPTILAFDIEGNPFVGDYGNNRIQKFQLIGSNQCDATTTTTSKTSTTSTTTSTTTTTSITTVQQFCSFIQMTIIPGISNISHPIQIRLEEDFISVLQFKSLVIHHIN